MKISILFILSSILFLTVSCNDDKYSVIDIDQEMEIKDDGTYVPGEASELRHSGIYTTGGVTPTPSQYILKIRTGNWTSTGCELGSTRTFVLVDYNSCACQKEFIISQLEENACYEVDQFCDFTNKVANTQCVW